MITTDSVIPGLRAGSKKQALQILASRAAEIAGECEQEIFECLLEREKLGSTGIGNGIAIPHIKLSGLTEITGVFARLERPINFDSVDERPVDLIFLLLAPESSAGEHLKVLARVSRLLRNEAVCDNLRNSDSADAIIALLNIQTSRESAEAA